MITALTLTIALVGIFLLFLYLILREQKKAEMDPSKIIGDLINEQTEIMEELEKEDDPDKCEALEKRLIVINTRLSFLYSILTR